MFSQIQKRIYEVLEIAEPEDRFSVVFDFILFSLILLNILSLILSSVDSFYIKYAAFFDSFKLISMILFSLEFAARIWISQFCFKQCQPGNYLKRLLNPLIFLDLVAILPFFLPGLIPFDLRFLRVFRLFRLIRSFKIGRYSESLNALGKVLDNEKAELFVITLVILSLLITSATLMFYVESEAQPEVFSSIPAALWWGIITLTTVGYGDIYPITTLGKFLGGIIAFLGLATFALPTGVIAFGFMSELQKRKANKMICPHCGKNSNHQEPSPPT